MPKILVTEKAGVVASFTGAMLAGEPAIVTGDVGDCARANDRALTIDHQPGIHNLGWRRPTSINESFFAPAKATGHSQPIQHGPARVGKSGEGIRLDSHPDPRTGFGEDFQTRRWRCDCVQVLC